VMLTSTDVPVLAPHGKTLLMRGEGNPGGGGHRLGRRVSAAKRTGNDRGNAEHEPAHGGNLRNCSRQDDRGGESGPGTPAGSVG